LSKKIALLCNAFSKGKGIWVEFKERDKLADGVPHWIPVLVDSWRIWHLDSIGYNPHRQLNSSLRKNLIWYSPIGA